jgi:hypothetical protein
VNDRVSSPRPRHGNIGKWSTFEQLDYTQPRGRDNAYKFTEVCENLKEGLDLVLHSWGVVCTRGNVYRQGDTIVVTLDLRSGDWHKIVKTQTTTARPLTRFVCSKVLRLIRRSHEELG